MQRRFLGISCARQAGLVGRIYLGGVLGRLCGRRILFLRRLRFGGGRGFCRGLFLVGWFG